MASNKVAVTDGGAVRYHWRDWPSALFWGTTGAFLIWLGFFGMDAPGLDCFSILLFFPGGITLLYFGIGKALNYTEFRNEAGSLLVQHKPLPWRGNTSIPLVDIHAIALNTHTQADGSKSRNVMAVFQDETGSALLSNLSLDESDSAANHLERLLGKPRKTSLGRRNIKTRYKRPTAKAQRTQQTGFSCSVVFVILLFLLTGIWLVYLGRGDLQRSRASYNWPTVTGRVVDVKIIHEENTDAPDTYTPIVTYEYVVNDRRHTSQQVSMRGESYNYESDATQAINRYPVNSQVTVYYDPDQPDFAILEPGVSGYGSLIAGIIFTGAGLAGIPVMIVYRKRRAKTRKNPR